MRQGDAVTWTSQSSGFSKEKTGIIAEVVPAGSRPSHLSFPYLYKNAGAGFARDHESYVVLVKNRPYWPRVKHLHLMSEERT